MPQNRIAVLGLDAFPYCLLQKASESGVAPFIFNNKTVTNGKRLSCIPPVTPASWPSMMSGVNPGKHGIFSFLSFDRKTTKSYFNTAVNLEHPRIHEIMSYEGLSSIMINPIPDFPLLHASKSVIISNLFFVQGNKGYSSEKGRYNLRFPV
jgi:predicted AlkP superfamily phosphohydrolase/phosphomutase